MRDEKVAQQIDSERRSAPRKRYATAAVPIIVNKQLVSEALCIDHKAAGTKRSESNNFPNDPLASDLDGREMSLRLKSACSSRD
jgi:hypothetical protein